jgi:hypothetical protein
LTENICVARGLANGTRVVFLKIGCYDKVIHDRVWNDIEGAIQRHETEVILTSPPDCMIVEVAHKSTQRSRLRNITQILPRDGPEISIDGTYRICIYSVPSAEYNAQDKLQGCDFGLPLRAQKRPG